MIKSDVIVVGNGGMGSAICYYLTLSGLKVVGIDRFSPPHQFGSSGGDTRLFRQAYFEDPRYIPLAKRSFELWMKLGVERKNELFTKTGFLVLSPENDDVAEKISSYANANEIELEYFSRNQIKNRFPQFTLPNNFVGQLENQAGFIRPELAIDAFLSLSRKDGAQFRNNEKVLSWESDGLKVKILTDKEEYVADHLVLSPGPWSSELLSTVPMTFAISRAPQFWFEGSDQHSHKANMPCFAFAEAGEFVYGFPKIDQKGLKIANYAPSEKMSDPMKGFEKYSNKELQPIMNVIRRFLPDVSTVPSNWKRCFFTLTQDENFLVDFHPEFKNVILATGGSGHAFKFVPLLGEIVTKMICFEKIDLDIAFLKLR